MSELDLYEVIEDIEEVGHVQYMAVLRDHWTTINAIKELLGCEKYAAAQDIWETDVPYSDRIILWKAPTRGFGSCWDTWERKALKEGAYDI